MKQPKRFVSSDKFATLHEEWKGVKVNKLTILGVVGYITRPDGGSVTPAAHVKCECGNESIKVFYQVRSGYIPSCGCINTLYKEPGEAARYDLMGRYRHSAKKRNFPFTLSFNEFKNIISQDCHYCGIEPLQSRLVKGCNGQFLYNGIDRVNSEKGYEIDNCVPCCFTCNRAKSKMPYERFIQYTQRFLSKHINN